MVADPAPARAVWRRLEVLHAVTYFAPESGAALRAAGYRGFWMGYFAARAAPLGPVGPEPVGALFYNFAPTRVAGALPDAWAIAGPDVALGARLDGATAALARILGTDDATTAAVGEAASLARRAATTAPAAGRALYAANHALPWPDDPHAQLWQAATLLREHRGDGHVALLTASGLSGRECNVFQSLAGNVPRSMITQARDYDDAEWDGIVASLTARGLLAGPDRLSDEGRALHRDLEADTDRLASSAYAALEDDERARLTELLTPLARAVVTTGEIPRATPMGPTFDPGSTGPA